ncbi:hypothetical protein ACV342_33955, partial [Pseudomonas aeruginosa]
TYLFIYRIPHPELEAWHRGSLLWPLSALGIALVVLTLFSLLLTLSITRPLNRLRRAAPGGPGCPSGRRSGRGRARRG